MLYAFPCYTALDQANMHPSARKSDTELAYDIIIVILIDITCAYQHVLLHH
jgi:hypothetical protein